MDILDFAMEMDRNGRDLYRNLARRAGRPEARRVFERMAEEEERLLAEYRRMKTQQAQADSRTLEREEDPFRRNAGISSGRDGVEALRQALEMENQVCSLFEKAAGREADAGARDLLRRVAAVECGAANELQSLYDFINAPNEYLAWGEFSNLDEFHNFGRYEDNRTCRHTA